MIRYRYTMSMAHLKPTNSPSLRLILVLCFHRLDILGVQLLDSWDDEALNFCIRFTIREAFGVDGRILLHGGCRGVAFGRVRNANPVVLRQRRDKNLVLLAMSSQS